jgi:N-acetylglucosamine kinase-like BadF-type ATPase
MIRHLAIDGGQTGCRIALREDGRLVASAIGGGLRRRARADPDEYLRALHRALEGLRPRPPAVDVVAAGLTGFDGSTATARWLADGLRSLVEAELVLVTNDAVTSYLGAIGAAPGAVVAAGAGVIALAADGNGRFARSDGWGYLLGDDGGGFSIGRQGLRSALRDHDGRDGSPGLRMRAQARFGALDAIARRVYDAHDPVTTIAAFAADVADAAREGDEVATRVWADAARELAATAKAAIGQVFPAGIPVTVSWTGSLFHAGDLLTEPFARHLRDCWPEARLTAPRHSALRGAELLAESHPCPMFTPLIHALESQP